MYPSEVLHFFAADALDMGPRLMGRQVAGRGYLKAIFEGELSNPVPKELAIAIRAGSDASVVKQYVDPKFESVPFKFYPSASSAQWPQKEVLYYPAPMNDALAWQRHRKGIASAALCGVTHTISTTGVMTQLAAYLSGPYAPWDALICTSQSVRQAVENVWAEELDWLRFRVAQKVNPLTPQLPVIPLGVHCDDFEFDAAERAAGRAQWKIETGDFVVVFVGRLSFHAKANPLPMYLSAARAAARTGVKVKILECGWFANQAIQTAYEQAAKLAGIEVVFADGRGVGVARRAYCSADVFVSLSDNIQETFGLTPIEAMAAGLPVVVSNWDGYRETVRHGQDGLLIPTFLPGDTNCAQTLSERYFDGELNYDMYLAHNHAMTSVDTVACEEALVTLIEQPHVRKAMGESGCQRARSTYDWRVVMAQYQALWAEQKNELLRARRFPQANAVKTPASASNPLHMFGHYPSHRVFASTRLCSRLTSLTPEVMGEYLQHHYQLAFWGFKQGQFPAVVEIVQVFVQLHSEGMVSVESVARARGWSVATTLQVVMWLHKSGLVMLEADLLAESANEADGVG